MSEKLKCGTITAMIKSDDTGYYSDSTDYFMQEGMSYSNNNGTYIIENGKSVPIEEHIQKKELEIVKKNFSSIGEFNVTKFKNLAINIMKDCPDSRERSLALTKLEECMFWANASIARND